MFEEEDRNGYLIIPIPEVRSGRQPVSLVWKITWSMWGDTAHRAMYGLNSVSCAKESAHVMLAVAKKLADSTGRMCGRHR